MTKSGRLAIVIRVGEHFMPHAHHHAEAMGWMMSLLMVSIPLITAGAIIAIVPEKALKTVRRPAWPGLILIFMGALIWGWEVAACFVVAAFCFSPIPLPVSRRLRLVAAVAALLVGGGLFARILSQFFTS